MRLSLHTKNTRIGEKYMIIYRFTIKTCLQEDALGGGEVLTESSKKFCKKY